MILTVNWWYVDGGRGLGDWGVEISLTGEDVGRLLFKLSPTSSLKQPLRWKPEAYSSISQPSLKRHLVAACRALMKQDLLIPAFFISNVPKAFHKSSAILQAPPRMSIPRWGGRTTYMFY